MIQEIRVIDNNYCVLFPTSRFPYLICDPDSGIKILKYKFKQLKYEKK